MKGLPRLLGRGLAMLAIVASTVSAPAATPVTKAWSADPEEQFLLDVQIRQYRLGDGVRAYHTPEGTCVLLGDFLATLDVPMKIDLAASKASGWAFTEKNRISIDRSAGVAEFGGQREDFAAEAVREVPEGWCVDVGALSRWFGIGVTAKTAGSMLLLESEAKLPVELAMERRDRAARIRKASFDLAALPQVKLPYRMWRAPAVDFMVSAGVTYNAHSGARVDRRAAMQAAGEIARLSYDARVDTDSKGIPRSLRVKAYRSDPDGELLGPLRATHVAMGDVQGVQSVLAGSGAAGRGAVLTNRPLIQPVAFDRTSFTGELPAGWDAELYRNGELIAFAAGGADGRYLFADVQLLYGDNRFEIVSYGPQGQVRSRQEVLNVGADHAPPGETRYWAGVVDPGRDLLSVRKDQQAQANGAGLRGAVSVEHGLDKRTSVAALVQSLVVDDQRVTYVEGAVRRSVGPALVEIAGAADDKGGLALRTQALARVGQVSVAAQSVVTRGFRAGLDRSGVVGDHRLAVDAPLKLGQRTVPLHGDVRMMQLVGGDRQMEGNLRASASLNRFNLATAFRYRKVMTNGGPAPPAEVELGLLGSGRLGPVRLRGSTEWQVAPHSRFERAELSAYWSAGETADWEGSVAYEGSGKRTRGRVSYIRRFDRLSLALTGEAASDRSVAAGVALNFSLDGGATGWRMSRQPLASAGSIRARVYRDLNANGTRDRDEPLERGALITAGLRVGDQPTGKDGLAAVGGLENYRPIAIGIDASSLSDPSLTPAKTAQVVVPRPGIMAEVEIALIGGGDIEGVLARSGGGGFEGLDVELVDRSGQVVATTRSDFDGYFLFDRVAYGRYSLRLSKASAAVAAVPALLRSGIEVTAAKPSVRMGTIGLWQAPSQVAINQEVGSDDLLRR
ncbi:collagen binding domain-containing protein [Sphingomonas sp. GCM10030256]|uniref:MSCRAMM family protein n=1 Tax=Sphingomonas sp. GCM10030256 TaxID=3273427 RepID=UPI0036137313